MKNILYAAGIICLFLILTECEKDNDNDTSGGITYVKTNPGGCNNQTFDDLKSTAEGQADTVVFSIINDTLDIYVGKNYICCAPFTTEADISDSSIIITITDTCLFPDQICYCRCACYYTWDFLFVDFEQKVYEFKIIIDDPQQEGPFVFLQGTVDLS